MAAFLEETNPTATNINSFGFSAPTNYGVANAEGGLTIDTSLIQINYPIKNTSTVPIYFNLNIEGIVGTNDIDSGEINVLFRIQDLQQALLTSSIKEQQDQYTQASLGDISVGGALSIDANNLIIYPQESIAIAFSDGDTSVDKYN